MPQIIIKERTAHLPSYFYKRYWSSISCGYCKVFKNSFFIEHLQKLSLADLFKISVLRSLANFTGKHLCWSLFLKNLQVGDLQLHKKNTQTQLFSCEVCKIFKNTLSYRTPQWLLLHLWWLLLYFFKKVLLNSYFAPLLRCSISFSSRNIVWCIQSWTRLFVNLSSIVRFSK